MENKKYSPVLKRLTIIPLTAMLFTLIVCIAACIYSFFNVQEQLAERTQASLRIAANQLDNIMEHVEQSFAEYAITNENHLFLKTCTSDTAAEKTLRYESNVRKWLDDLVGLIREVQTTFVYYRNMEKFQFRGVSSYAIQKLVQDLLLLDDGSLPSNSWNLLKADDDNWYLLYVFHMGDFYGGAWLPVSALKKSLSLDSDAYPGITYLQDLSGNTTYPDETVSQILAKDPEQSSLSDGKTSFRNYTEKAASGGITVGLLSPQHNLFSRIPPESWFLFIAAFLAMILVAVVVFWLHRRIVNPVREIDEGMKIIAEGNLDYRLPLTDYATYNEFDRLSMHFNAMMDQLDEVQFKLYETTLKEQKTKLNYISQQIRPHFILNALNIIYTYDESEFPLVKKMVMYLTAYFRYIVNLNRDFVEVGEELEHTRNYLMIQKERYPHRFDFLVECGIRAEKVLIPPLIIQTFLENSIKYGMKDEGRSFFFVNVAVKDETAQIFIADTGKGFDEKTLKMIQTYMERREYTDELGVGIQNTIERLDILYDGQAVISFENEETGGAIVQIQVPARYA